MTTTESKTKKIHKRDVLAAKRRRDQAAVEYEKSHWEFVEFLRQARASGWNVSELAETFGVSTPRIYQLLNKEIKPWPTTGQQLG